MTSPDLLRTVVVDDEPHAREELCYLLGQMPGVLIVGQAGDGLEALAVIAQHEPDMVLLDIQMPGLTGFEVARRLADSDTESRLVFVTAFDRHAVEAFEINAVDYLLKPVEAERLATAVDRVRKRVQSERAGHPGPDLFGAAQTPVSGDPRALDILPT